MGSNNSNTPALAPPNGLTSNLDKPDVDGSLQTTITLTLVFCLMMTTGSVVARSRAQYFLFKRPVWADFWMWFAWASHVAFATMLLIPTLYAAGYHQWDVSLENYYKFKFWLFVSFVLYDLAIVGAKVAILLQLSALFAGNRHNRFYWASLTLILANLVFYVAISFALIFQCQPISKAWDPRVGGSCLDQDALLTSSGPFNIISDFLIFLLPIWAIWQLQLPLRRRLMVISAFTVGLFGCICSAVRVVYSHRLSESGDSTWTLMQNQLWANAEITAGIVIACVFIMPRYIRHVRNRPNHYEYHWYGASGVPPNDPNFISDDTTWNGGRTATQNKISREPYIELAENDEGGQQVTPAAENVKEAAPTSKKRKRESRTNGASALSHESASTGENKIVKTVEIETVEEHVEPRAPEPVAVPGAAI